MIFARMPLDECLDAILAHTIKLESGTLKKGRVLTAADIGLLRAAGYGDVMAARLEAGDVAEDAAAGHLAGAVAGNNLDPERPFTGRCNLRSTVHGVLRVNREGLDRINLIHESITIAALDDGSVITPGQLAATVKIIPFAVSTNLLEQAVAAAGQPGDLLQAFSYRPRTIGFIQTRLPGTREEILDKATGVLTDRLRRIQGTLANEIRCGHEEAELSSAIRATLASGVDLVIVSGATATVDRDDVVPRSIEGAGGEIVHYGMPVDPGNLLLLAHSGAQPIIGMPGCARSPSLNGFDWVLERLAAGMPVTAQDIMRMGCGGLLKEISARGQLRDISDGPGT